MTTTEKPNGGGYVYIPIVNIKDIAFNQEIAPYIKYKIGDIKYYVDNPNTYDGTTVAKTVAQIINNANATDVEYLFNTGYLHNGENTKYNFEQRAFVGETTIKPENGHMSSEHDKLKNFRERKDGSKEDDGLVLIDVKGKAANSFDEINYRNNGTEVGRNWGYRPRVIWNNWDDTKYIKILEKINISGKPFLHIVDSIGQEYNIELKPQQEVIIAKQTNVIDLNEIKNKNSNSFIQVCNLSSGGQSLNEANIASSEYKWENSNTSFPKAVIEKAKRYETSFIPMTIQQQWKTKKKQEYCYLFSESSYFLQYETQIESELKFSKLINRNEQQEINDEETKRYCELCFNSQKDSSTPVLILNLQRSTNSTPKVFLPGIPNKEIIGGELDMRIENKGMYYHYLQNWKDVKEDVNRTNYYYYCGLLYGSPIATLAIKPSLSYHFLIDPVATTVINGQDTNPNSLFSTDTNSLWSSVKYSNIWKSETAIENIRTADFLVQDFTLPPHFLLKKDSLQPCYLKKEDDGYIELTLDLFIGSSGVKEIQDFDQWLLDIYPQYIKTCKEQFGAIDDYANNLYELFVGRSLLTNYYFGETIDTTYNAYPQLQSAFQNDKSGILQGFTYTAGNKWKDCIRAIGITIDSYDLSSKVIPYVASIEEKTLKNLFTKDRFKRIKEYRNEVSNLTPERKFTCGSNKLIQKDYIYAGDCISKIRNPGKITVGYESELHYKMRLKESENAQEQIAILII